MVAFDTTELLSEGICADSVLCRNPWVVIDVLRDSQSCFNSVPQYGSLKNNYTLLWDMKDNDGYIKVVAAMQKFFDQAISGNWSYNPENYDNNEVPVSVMAGDFLKTYKYGWKTSYYQNTYDIKSDEPQLTEEKKESIQDLLSQILETEEEDCDSCKI